MSVGGGHSNIEETMSALGVPIMTKRSFIASKNVRSMVDGNLTGINR